MEVRMAEIISEILEIDRVIFNLQAHLSATPDDNIPIHLSYSSSSVTGVMSLYDTHSGSVGFTLGM